MPSVSAKNESDVEFVYYVLYDDGQEADFCSESVKKARRLYLDNYTFDRRKMLVTRDDTDDEYVYQENLSSEEEEEEEAFIPNDSSQPANKKIRVSSGSSNAAAASKPKMLVTRDDTNDEYMYQENLSIEEEEEEEEAFVPNDSSQPATKKIYVSSSSSNAAAASKPTPSQPRDSRKKPQEIWSGTPNEPIEGGWPAGWVKRTFKRMNISKKHTDSYWYSPQEQYKLRSMKEVERFFDALKQEHGDEKEAWKVFKGRK
ncbi:MAG: hypothetical protein SGILL_002313 [Bacillariaceae sp.]